MAKKERTRLAYLIRLWHVHSEERMAWRASPEDAHSGEKKGFGDPAALAHSLANSVQGDFEGQPTSLKADSII